MAHAFLTNDAKVAETFQREGDESHGTFSIEVPTPIFHSGSRVYLSKTSPYVLRPIDRLFIHGACEIGKGRVRLQFGELGTVRVAWGSTVLRGRDAMVVAAQEHSAATALRLHISESDDIKSVKRS